MTRGQPDYPIAVFVSGGGTNLQAILDQIRDGRLFPVRVAIVIASNASCLAIGRAERAGIPTRVIRKKDYPDLASYDQALIGALKPYAVSLVVLAGFLSLLGPDFIAAYPDQIVNIHPSLIPSFCGPGFYGIRPHEAALAYGVRLTGATVHLVDGAYDHGPIVLQQAVSVLPEDTPQSMQQRVMHEAEQVLLPRAIALFAAGRVRRHGRTIQILEETQDDETSIDQRIGQNRPD